MATMMTSAPPTPQQSRSFSFRRTLYVTTSKRQQRSKASGNTIHESEETCLNQRVSGPPAPSKLSPIDSEKASSKKAASQANTEHERQLTPVPPPERSPPPIPDLHVPKLVPPDVQNSQHVPAASPLTRLGKPRNDKHRINITEPPEHFNSPQSNGRNYPPAATEPSPLLLNPFPGPKPRTLSSSFVDFAKRSFSPVSSRSTSPIQRDSKDNNDDILPVNSARSFSTTTTPTSANLTRSADSSPDRNKPLLDRFTSDSIVTSGAKKTRKGFGTMFLRTNLSTPDLQTATMAGRIPSQAQLSPSQKKARDELWEPYRALENDLNRFSSTKSDKTIIVRQFLLPFLERWKGKCSREIAPEDLEKRVRLLHKWWVALLAQARTRSSQYMPGAERPFYMEAISAIMSRPEWRMAPSSFAPLSAKESLSTKSASSDSLSSASSGFSIHTAVQHNIKSLYSTAIYDTLAFVVEKMGYRTASPAVVAFGGKVIAYAFFFCNGVPEMLVHLWNLPSALVRRVLPEFGVGRSADMRDMSDAIVGEFPEALHCLGFCSFVQMLRLLRQQPKVPVGAVDIDWRGPWLNRWCGRDSDLVYVFFKHYHILMYDYLPSSPSPAARICAPGYVPVLVQISVLVDGTIGKQSGQPTETAATTFEDLLNASAALPLAPKVTTRGGMAESPLVILLQDVLLNQDCPPECRTAFADSFIRLLKLSVRRTQRYDSNACFQLCELLEEVLQVMTEMDRTGHGDHFDWDFWFEVLNTMLAVENNMTELRVISFVYTIWDTLVKSEERKRKWCMEWLLSDEIWERFFYHWCPMVRAYFQRLICWRIARYRSGKCPIDAAIYGRMLALLDVGFKCHTRLLEDKGFSSTAPCFPAPSRRLVILKNDPPVSPQGVLLDGIIPTTPMGPKLNSTGAPTFAAILQQQEQAREEEGYGINKRWSQLRSAFGFKTSSAGSASEDTTSPKSSRLSTSSISSNASDDAPTTAPPPASFKFSLEWMEHRMMGREQKLTPSRLPKAAQAYFESLENEERPSGELIGAISPKYLTYVGRSLAEWRLIVLEHENFINRRREEGRPTDNDVETPTLGVDSVRKF